jgi:hypothetical protein
MKRRKMNLYEENFNIWMEGAADINERDQWIAGCFNGFSEEIDRFMQDGASREHKSNRNY